MKRTGQLLREARESSGVSLQEVSVHLKISIRILKALEEGDEAHLPAKTFLRGFVKSYAQFLKADQNHILDVFQQEMGTTHPKMITKQVEMAAEPPKVAPIASGDEDVPPLPPETPKAPPPAPRAPEVESTPVFEPPPKVEVSRKPEDYMAAPKAPTLSVDQKTWSHSMKVMTVGAVLVIAAIIFGVLKTIEKYERETQLVPPVVGELKAVPRPESGDGAGVTTSAPNGTMSEAPATNPPPPIPNPDGTVPPTVMISATPSPMASTAPATPTPVVAVSTPTPTPSATPSPTLSATPKATVATGSAQGSSTPTPTASPNPSKRSHEVIVEALDKVVIDYSIDGKPAATMTLNPEKVHTFRGDKKLTLGFSDGGSVNIIYNGKDKGVPGNLGKPLKMSFP